MSQKILFACLILGQLGLMGLPSHDKLNSPRFITRTPQSLATSRPTVFNLVNGTEGCPSLVEWRQECQGFAMHFKSDDREGGVKYFCNINKGETRTQEKLKNGTQQVRSNVTTEENVFRKTEQTIYSHKNSTATILDEDTVILDQTGKLLWEHSRNKVGFSCLFSN